MPRSLSVEVLADMSLFIAVPAEITRMKFLLWIRTISIQRQRYGVGIREGLGIRLPDTMVHMHLP